MYCTALLIYLLRPILLTSKAFYDLVGPHLYRCILWPVRSSTHSNVLNKQLLDILDRNNRALDHSKRIELLDCDEFSKAPDTDYEYPDVELFVHFLPNNILGSFQWNSWHPLPSKIYRTLLSRQRSLTELELNYTEIALDELYGYGSTSLLRGVKCLKRLRIMPGPGEALSHAGCELFQQHREINHLTLDLCHLRDDDEAGWGDSSAANGGILGKLFRHLKPSGNCLRILELNSVYLRGSQDVIGSAINPKRLKELTIAKCLHTEDFLMAANKKLGKKDPLRLTRFVIYHARDWKLTNHAPDADNDMASTRLVKELSTLLTSTTKSLRELWVCLRGYDALPNVGSIISHGSTLSGCSWILGYLKEHRQSRTPFRNGKGYVPASRLSFGTEVVHRQTPLNSMESWTTLTNKKDLAVINFGLYEKLTHDRNPDLD
ncbi:MAG: hypothetical protein Q9207_005461 [Kuettlingeria erythrocarpa]